MRQPPRRYTLSNLSLETGDVVTVTGHRNLSEYARIDSLTLTQVTDSTPVVPSRIDLEAE